MTVRGVEKVILLFEEYTIYCDFGHFARTHRSAF